MIARHDRGYWSFPGGRPLDVMSMPFEKISELYIVAPYSVEPPPARAKVHQRTLPPREHVTLDEVAMLIEGCEAAWERLYRARMAARQNPRR